MKIKKKREIQRCHITKETFWFLPLQNNLDQYYITWPNVILTYIIVILDQWNNARDFRTNFEHNFKKTSMADITCGGNERSRTEPRHKDHPHINQINKWWKCDKRFRRWHRTKTNGSSKNKSINKNERRRGRESWTNSDLTSVTLKPAQKRKNLMFASLAEAQ